MTDGPSWSTQTWGEQAAALRQARERGLTNTWSNEPPDHSLDPAVYLVLGIAVLVLVVVFLIVD